MKHHFLFGQLNHNWIIACDVLSSIPAKLLPPPTTPWNFAHGETPPFAGAAWTAGRRSQNCRSWDRKDVPSRSKRPNATGHQPVQSCVALLAPAQWSSVTLLIIVGKSLGNLVPSEVCEIKPCWWIPCFLLEFKQNSNHFVADHQNTIQSSFFNTLEISHLILRQDAGKLQGDQTPQWFHLLWIQFPGTEIWLEDFGHSSPAALLHHQQLPRDPRLPAIPRHRRMRSMRSGPDVNGRHCGAVPGANRGQRRAMATAGGKPGGETAGHLRIAKKSRRNPWKESPKHVH